MSGERDLGRLLAGLDPALDPRPYRFVASPADGTSPLAPFAFALVREDEGTTLVVEEARAESAGAPPGPAFARLTLRIHSDLEAVGLVAAVAGRLATAGIAVNPIAGLRHDHLLVPWAERSRALGELLALAREAGGGAGGR